MGSVWRKFLVSVIGVIAVVLAFHAVSAQAEEFKLVDLDNHWAEAAIKSAVQTGYVTGYPDGKFKPNAQITRAEFVTMLARASGLSDTGSQASFDDVSETNWAAGSIYKGIGMGFINPSEFDKTFSPNKALTRAEMVRWLVNGLAKSDPDYAQALKDTENTILPFTEFYGKGFEKSDIPYIAVAHGVGLVGGFPDGSFGADQTTTRAEVVVLLSRYLKLEGTKADSYRGLNELREVGTTGTNMTSLTEVVWPGDQPITKLIGKEIAFTNNYATAKINKIIVVDFSKGMDMSERGIYAPMFYWKTPVESDNTAHLFYELSLTPKKNITEIQTFLNGIPGITGESTNYMIAKKYSLDTVSVKEVGLFKEGINEIFWTETFLRKNHIIVSATALDGTYGGFKIIK